MELTDGEIVYLAGLVAREIRKHQPSIDSFTPRDGQLPGEAAAVLAQFRDKQSWRREVLGKLADATTDPARWRASSAAELDLDEYER
jgi:hypothetical protein